jgi:hypothetical protein
MKTLYNVAERDYCLDRSYGMFDNEAVAEAFAERVNQFNGRTDESDDTRAMVYKQYVVEAGDMPFTHCAVYNILDDQYLVLEECPTMFDKTMDESWIRDRLTGKVGNPTTMTHIQVYGHSVEHAQLRCMALVDSFKAEGLIQLQRTTVRGWQSSARSW